MSALVLVIRHRTVDLPAMSALRALRADLGHGDAIEALRREDAFVLEGDGVGNAAEPDAWLGRCLEQANWHNPNKHRYGMFSAFAGTHAALQAGRGLPAPWLQRLLATDRPDLVVGGGWAEWSGQPGVDAATSVTLASWDREQPVKSLPGRDWPGVARVARLQLWSLDVTGPDPRARAEACAVTRSRRDGLLVNPHMEGWSWVETTT